MSDHDRDNDDHSALTGEDVTRALNLLEGLSTSLA